MQPAGTAIREGRFCDPKPTINEMVLQNLTRGGRNPTGAEGMTAEQIVRAAIIKKTEELTYEGLAFHLADSRTYRAFWMDTG
jgi:IS5 family transposase